MGAALKISRSDFYSIQWILQFVKVLWISAEPVWIHDLQLTQDLAPSS